MWYGFDLSSHGFTGDVGDGALDVVDLEPAPGHLIETGGFDAFREKDAMVRNGRVEIHWEVGLLEVDAWYFDSSERIDALPETRRRGFRWTVRRRFGGWLPVKTGLSRRGVIR